MFKRLISKFKKNATDSLDDAQIIPREDHDVSRDHISENALKVLYKLNNAGFDSYLWVAEFATYYWASHLKTLMW